jgi:hypothetical protein
MQGRKPLTVNNSRKSLSQLFNRSVKINTPFVKSQEAPLIATYAGRGRQNSEGFGGGYRVLRRGQ